jgi:hypothetical protein
VLEDLRDGAVVRVLGDAVAAPVAALRDEDIENPQNLLRPRMRNSEALDSSGSLAGQEIFFMDELLGVYAMRSCVRK